MSPEAPRRPSPWVSLALFLVALVWLSFSREAIHAVVQSDAPSYLAVARSEPRHSAFDGAVYLIHPPAYPCAIRAASWLVGDLVQGGVLLGLTASAGLVVLTFHVGLALGLTELAALGGALVLLASRALEFGAHGIYREPFQGLLVHALLLALVAPGGSARRERVLVGVASGAGVLAAWTWDPIGFAAPLVAVAGWLAGQKRRGLLAAVAVLVAWLVWAELRREVLAAHPSYPAGIDGTVEETSPLPLGALLNPNLLEETRVHNAYWWPARPTPDHLLSLLGPEALAVPSPFLDARQPPLFLGVAAALLGLAALGAASLVLSARGGDPAARARARSVLGVGLVAGFLSGLGVVGLQARYSVSALPLLALLAAHGALEAVAFFRRRPVEQPAPPRTLGALLGAGALAALAWASVGHLVPARPTIFEGRAAARAIARLGPDLRIAAAGGWPSTLAWLLPEDRALALPRRADRLDAFLADYPPDVVVLPLEVRRRAGDEDVAPELVDRALGIAAIGSLARRARPLHPEPRPRAPLSTWSKPQHGELLRLGYALEADPTDEPHLRACEILAYVHGTDGPRAHVADLGLVVPPGEGDAILRAILAGRARPVELALLRDHRDDLERAGEQRLVEALDRLR